GKIQNNTEIVYINHEWLKNFTDKFPSILQGSNYSFYFQIANNDNKEILVINKLGPGYGKHFSRYCNLFVGEGNDEFINSIKKSYR
ncbi:hypothetical protein OSK38_28500, partial [Escherichia coli]|nr:hypothetical protein [Escherichia coli]